jgi:ketosteroid isomerase-like protein
MKAEPGSADELARRFFDAVEAADVDALLGLYANGAEMWTNVTGRVTDARALARFLPAMKRRMPDRRYVDRRVIATATGFVHTHRITGTRADGARVALLACAIVTVEGGKIARVEEYLDSRQLAAVF